MSTTFKVTIRSTSIAVYPGEEAFPLLGPLIDLLTYEDEYVEETKTLGYMYEPTNDTLYFHKGVDLNYLRKWLVDVEFVTDLHHDYEDMKFDFEEIIPPRDKEQVDVINFISGMKEHSSNVNDSQVFLVLKTGKGKTYCSGTGMCLYKTKTLIIVHRDTLREQWINSLFKMQGLSYNEVYPLISSEELYGIANGDIQLDYDVYIMTHATFRAGLKRLGSLDKASKITENLKIGMKIIDEAHLEFRDTLCMDFAFNVKRNLYLTATDGRSSKDENAIFRHCFSKATFYRPSSLITESNLPKKWVEYTQVNINTHVKASVYKYRINGGRGMNAISYGKWCIATDKNKTHFKVCRDIVKMAFEEDGYSKILIFMPLIDLCESCAKFLEDELEKDDTFGYDLTIRTINSQNSKSENERNKRADVIITTIGSAGTGTDLPGLTDIISCSPWVSRITCEQVFGRLRYCGKICHYYDIVDESVHMDKIWARSRRKKYKQLALNLKDLTWSEEDNNE